MSPRGVSIVIFYRVFGMRYFRVFCVAQNFDFSRERIFRLFEGEVYFVAVDFVRHMQRFFARLSPFGKDVFEGIRLRRFARKAFQYGDYWAVGGDECGGIYRRFSAVVRIGNFGCRAEYVEVLRPLFGRGVFPSVEVDSLHEVAERSQGAVVGSASRAVVRRKVVSADAFYVLVRRNVLKLAVAVVDEHTEVAVGENRRRVLGCCVLPRRIDRARKSAARIFFRSDCESCRRQNRRQDYRSRFHSVPLCVFEDSSEDCKRAPSGVNKQGFLGRKKNPRALPRAGIFVFKVPTTEPLCAYRPAKQTLRGKRMRARASAGCAPSARP